MIRKLAKEVYARIKVSARESWGAPFIMGFILLLMFAAVSLAMGLALLAEVVGVAAYCALVAGVVLQLVWFLKFRKKEGELD